MAKHALTLMNARQVTLNVMIMQNVSIQRDHMNAIVTMDTMVMAKTVMMWTNVTRESTIVTRTDNALIPAVLFLVFVSKVLKVMVSHVMTLMSASKKVTIVTATLNA